MPDTAEGSRDRSERFIRHARDRGEVWGLRNAEGWANCPSNEDDQARVILFWSHKALAQACAKDEWSDYQPESIELAEFLDAWLPGMAGDGVRAGIDWTAKLVGLEWAPDELRERLSE